VPKFVVTFMPSIGKSEPLPDSLVSTPILSAGPLSRSAFTPKPFVVASPIPT
jgi:hypothetical protein